MPEFVDWLCTRGTTTGGAPCQQRPTRTSAWQSARRGWKGRAPASIMRRPFGSCMAVCCGSGRTCRGRRQAWRRRPRRVPSSRVCPSRQRRRGETSQPARPERAGCTELCGHIHSKQDAVFARAPPWTAALSHWRSARGRAGTAQLMAIWWQHGQSAVSTRHYDAKPSTTSMASAAGKTDLCKASAQALWK